MYRKNKPARTKIKLNTSYVGETIENKIRRIVNNKEPITDGAKLTYTERKDGVLPEYNPKTDRWVVALEAMDKVAKSHQAKREHRISLGEQAKKGMEKEGGETPANTNDKK